MHKVLLPILSLLFIFICVTGCINKCKDCHYVIEFSNESNKDVYVIWATNYPDSMDYLRYSMGPTSTASGNNIKVLAKTKNRPIVHRYHWEALLKNGGLNPYNILMILIFDVETVDAIDWLSVDWYDPTNYDKYVLQRYDLTLEDIEWLNWNIPYPPTEKMRDMKMYPPYSGYEK